MNRWVSFDGKAWHGEIPARPACYVIYLDGRLRYVGQTTNLRHRIHSGHGIDLTYYSDSVTTREWGQARNCIIKANFGTRYGDWAMRELRLIRRLQPDFNCVGSVRRRAA